MIGECPADEESSEVTPKTLPPRKNDLGGRGRKVAVAVAVSLHGSDSRVLNPPAIIGEDHSIDSN